MKRYLRLAALIVAGLFVFLGSGCEEEESGSIKVVGANSPAVDEPLAEKVSFDGLDKDLDEGELWGTVVISPATDESTITEYKLYWGSSETTKLQGEEVIATLVANGTEHEHYFEENTIIPTNASHLLVYSVYNGTESTTATALDIPDGVLEMVKNINTNADTGSKPDKFVNMNGMLYFFADDAPTWPSNWGLWRSDGTSTGTTKVTTSDPFDMDWLGMVQTAVINEKLFFTASQGSTHNNELWVSDGTAAGTFEVEDLYSGPEGSNPEMFTSMGGNLYFGAYNGSINNLYQSSGSAISTVTPYYPQSTMTAVGNTLFFNASDPSYGTELWKSDGTAGNATFVHDLNSGAGDGMLGNFTAYNGMLIFSGENGIDGVELWKSNGTGNQTGGTGTVMIKDINPGSVGSEPKGFKEFNGELYFFAYPAASTKALWKTDGTEAGTKEVGVITTDFDTSDPKFLTVAGDNLFFVAQDSSMNEELWVSDGTAVNKVKEINPSAGSYPDKLTAFNDYLFFQADDGTHGFELWVSDGTEAGTYMMMDLNASGEGFPTDGGIAVIDNTLFFGGSDGSANGVELWKYYIK